MLPLELLMLKCIPVVSSEDGKLRRIINRYKGCRIHAVYEACYLGIWLFDLLTHYGVDCIVNPPSLIPKEYDNRVKTDRLDIRKLA
jgi:transposase